MKPIEIINVNERTKRAITLFHEVAKGVETYGWNIAFLSGFAIDAHYGYLTKDHKDVDIIISKEEAKELAEYLEELGHTVYESDRFIGEVLKVDQADPEKDSQCHCDIHYYSEEAGRIVIPLLGKKLVINADFDTAVVEKNFLDEKVNVLKPEYLLEEKVGWCEQIGLSQCREKSKIYNEDLEKINYLIRQQ